MEGYLMHCLLVLCFIRNSEASLHNSPCKRTSEWTNYQIHCLTNHTIYITKLVIEDGFQGLLSPALGCSVNDAVYCGVELLTNRNISLKYFHELAVSRCNGRMQCVLTKEYFTKAEETVKKFCDTSVRPELQSAPFRQSIDYECIQDYQVIDMSVVKNESRPYGPVYLKASSASCSCDISGSMSRIEILQAHSVFLLIQSKENRLLEHPDTSVGLYGVQIPVQTEDITITILNGTNTTLAFMKVRGEGILSIRCSTYQILRREFRVQNGIESRSSQSSQTYGALKLTTSDTKDQQVVVRRARPDVTFTIGDVLNLILSFFIIFLLFLSFLYKWRTHAHVSAEIKFKDKEQRFVLVCHPKKEQKRARIEIHQSDCMCDRHLTGSTYTPLQTVTPNDDPNQRSKSTVYTDVV